MEGDEPALSEHKNIDAFGDEEIVAIQHEQSTPDAEHEEHRKKHHKQTTRSIINKPTYSSSSKLAGSEMGPTPSSSTLSSRRSHRWRGGFRAEGATPMLSRPGRAPTYIRQHQQHQQHHRHHRHRQQKMREGRKKEGKKKPRLLLKSNAGQVLGSNKTGEQRQRYALPCFSPVC